MAAATSSFLDDLRLLTCFTLLRWYVVPRTKLRARLSRLLGTKIPEVQHMLANASIRWLSSFLTIPQFRAVTGGQAVEVEGLLRGCPTLLEEKATTERVSGQGFNGIYIAKFPKSTHIIMYVHGGGFVSGSPESVSPYLLQLGVELRARGIIADIFGVSYNLAPESPYPEGLRQIALAYDNHVKLQNKPIILLGDSAGGNLCLGLLRHLVEAHPEIPRLHLDGEQGHIVAACMVSPWCDLRNEGESFRRNADDDCLDKAALDRWRDAYLGGQKMSTWTNPADIVHGWRDILPGKMLLISGTLDLFVSDVLKLATRIRDDGYTGLDVHVAPMKGHVWNMVDFGATVPGKAPQRSESGAYQGIWQQADWIARVLGQASPYK